MNNQKRILSFFVLSLLLISFVGFVVANDVYDTGYQNALDGVENPSLLENSADYRDGYYQGINDLETFGSADDIPGPSSSDTGDSIDTTTKGDLDVGVDFSDTEVDASWLPDFLADKYKLWVEGVSWDDKEDRSILAETIKWFMLILVILLVYSGLGMANFPKNAVIRILLSIVTGFLATFLITTPEMISMLQSYSALGVALTIFFPIMILGFFTAAVIKNGTATGIFVQQILWIVYSVYLFFKTIVLLILKQMSKNTITEGVKAGFVKWGFLKITINKNIANSLSGYSSLMLIVLIITAIAVFWIMVLGNRRMRLWVDRQHREAEADAFASDMARSREYRKQTSEEMKSE